MASLEALQESIANYELQLAQVQQTLDASLEASEDLVTLKDQLVELITLTKESLQTAQSDSTPSQEDEYALFQAEISALDKEGADVVDDERNSAPAESIESELSQLEGMKCQAPHSQAWGRFEYHNAIVLSVTATEEVSNFEELQVCVVFTNPTCQNMLPCQYFMEGRCKFSDEECRYSHGEMVPLSQLREYKEPDFSTIAPQKKVLAKHTTGLWYEAIIETVDTGECLVKFKSNGTTDNLKMADLLPLSDDEESEDSSEDDCDWNTMSEVTVQEEEPLTMWASTGTSALGEWEKYTKGIGSKLMILMGYEFGKGLGKDGEGRIEPVEAVVMPPGKSLDRCMELKEKAGGENLFKVERRLKRQQKKAEERSKRQYEQEMERRTLFDFINNKLSKSKGDSPSCSKDMDLRKTKLQKSSLKDASTTNLNVRSYQIEQNIRTAEKELSKLQQSFDRHSNDSVVSNRLKEKIKEKQAEIAQMQTAERNIQTEQANRKNRRKLTVF